VTHATLLVDCQDRTGLVAALSDFVFRHDGNIVDLDQHSEPDTGRFFMRLVWDTARFRLDRAGIRSAVGILAQAYDLRWRLHFADERPRLSVFATKAPHCLYDLLLAHSLGELAGDIAVVVANHPDLGPVAAHFDVPFVHIPSGDKAAVEARQRAVLAEHRITVAVLARYMQILSPAFVADWEHRIINIHHSFLPAFVGAKPYHQARERGVKIIGATAHYVTADLDQGPIIEQAVARVSHRDAVEDLQRKGRELERQVLTRAVRLHLQHRVLVHGNRTVVFDG
jgi:formyltetrahydrofolate deformylase